MKKISTIALSLLTAATVGAHANTFQSEVGFVSTSISDDFIDADTMLVGGTINFASIDVGSDPFNEASFLSHSSSLSFNLSSTDRSYPAYYGYDSFSSEYQAFELNMVVPDSNMVWGLGLTKSDDDDDNSGSITTFQIGSYTTPTSMVLFNIVTGDLDSVIDITGFGFGMKNVTVNPDGTGTSLIFSVDQLKYSIDDYYGSFSYKSTLIEFVGAYYVSQKTNISFGLSVANGEDSDDGSKTFTFALKSFVAPNLSIQASMGKTSYSYSGFEDDDIISFGASFRF